MRLPIPTEGEIAYRIPKLENSFSTWSQIIKTELSGDTFGAVVELKVNIDEPVSVIKSFSYPKISLIAEGNLSRGFLSTPMKAILEVKPVGKEAGTG
jgi:hypothetical protein